MCEKKCVGGNFFSMAGPTVKAVVASVAVSIYRRHLGHAIRLLFDLLSLLHVKLPCPGDLYLPRTMGASGDCEIHALRATTSSSCGLRLAIRPPHHHHAHRRACLAGRPMTDDGELQTKLFNHRRTRAGGQRRVRPALLSTPGLPLRESKGSRWLSGESEALLVRQSTPEACRAKGRKTLAGSLEGGWVQPGASRHGTTPPKLFGNRTTAAGGQRRVRVRRHSRSLA